MKRSLAFLSLKKTIGLSSVGGLVLVFSLYLVGCVNETLFASSLSPPCDEREGDACEEYFDSEDLKRSSSRRRSKRRSSRRGSSRSSDRSDTTGRVFSGGNDLTVAYCSNQAEEFLKIQKRYHLEEVRTHTFMVKYNALWTAYNRLGSSVPEAAEHKFQRLAKDFNDHRDDHVQLNTEYLRFESGEINYEQMEEVIESHESGFDSMESKYSNLFSEWFDKHISEGDKKNNESNHDKLIVRLEKLLVESCDFVLEACDRLLNDGRLTEDVRRLTEEHDRVWKESVRLLEEFNRTRKKRITEQRFQVAKKIRKIEENILDEL